MARLVTPGDTARSRAMIEIISSRSGLASLQTEWNALADKLRTPLVRHEWFVACAQAYAEAPELAIFVLRDAHGLRAVAPLVVAGSGLTRRLIPLSHRTGEPQALLFDDEDALARLCAAMVGTGLPLRLQRVGARELRAVQERARGRGLCVVRPDTTQTAWARFDGDWDAFEAGTPAKLRSALRGKRRRLQQEGALKFEAVSPDGDSVGRCLDELFQIEAAGWKGRSGTAITQDPWMSRFISEYGRRAAGQGMLRLFFLRVGETAVAARMSVEHASRIWHVKTGYDERWAKYSPGILLTHEVLRHACERGLDGCEYLGIAEEWQRRWPVNIRQYGGLRFYPASLRGGISLLTDAAGLLGRRARVRTQSGPEGDDAGEGNRSQVVGGGSRHGGSP